MIAQSSCTLYIFIKMCNSYTCSRLWLCAECNSNVQNGFGTAFGHPDDASTLVPFGDLSHGSKRTVTEHLETPPTPYEMLISVVLALAKWWSDFPNIKKEDRADFFVLCLGAGATIVMAWIFSFSPHWTISIFVLMPYSFQRLYWNFKDTLSHETRCWLTLLVMINLFDGLPWYLRVPYFFVKMFVHMVAFHHMKQKILDRFFSFSTWLSES